jgi:D-lactate dehydrogenase (cytochrome)
LCSQADRNLFYPVDPTETGAAIGGTVATNASGARSMRYGSTRRWVRALTLVLADGTIARIRRGEVAAAGNELSFPRGFPGGLGGRRLALPGLQYPQCKCAAGYVAPPGCDLVDIVVGSEGTLCAVAEVELALARAPSGVITLIAFFPEGANALDLVAPIRSDEGLSPLAIEYFDENALGFMRRARAGGNENVPEIPDGKGSALFIEVTYEDESDLDDRMATLDAHLRQGGGSMEDTWAGDTPAERAKMRSFRHCLPEAVNSLVGRLRATCSDLHKVGTDLAVPEARFAEMVAEYRRILPETGLEWVLFGHAGDCHLHANMIPRSAEDLRVAKAAALELARKAVAMGGAVTAEHGIGRLKRELLEVQYGREGVRAMREIKRFFDPEGIFNPGVLFAAS